MPDSRVRFKIFHFTIIEDDIWTISWDRALIFPSCFEYSTIASLQLLWKCGLDRAVAKEKINKPVSCGEPGFSHESQMDFSLPCLRTGHAHLTQQLHFLVP